MDSAKILTLAFFLGWPAAPAAIAQNGPVKPENARYGDPTSIGRVYQGYISGVIKGIDEKEIVLEKTKYGVDKTFKLDRKTKFIRDEKSSSREKLKIGELVWVDAKTQKKTGEMIAKTVVTGVTQPAP